MKILLTGPTGQVGSALRGLLPPLGDLVALDRSQLDLARPNSIGPVVRHIRPHIIINAAGYTGVEKAETEETLALRINAEAPAVLAEESAKLGALLIHFSTDYVFDGEKPSPYLETDQTNPLNAYGRTKLAGEQAIQASGCRYIIFRTSWVYGASGKNFMRTMLSLARERKRLRVVNDQFGAPTSNLMLAAAVSTILPRVTVDSLLDGVYHITASGHTTWHGFARAIFDATGIEADLYPISTDEYNSAIRRPRNSILDNAKVADRLGLRLPSWEQGLGDVLGARILVDRSSRATVGVGFIPDAVRRGKNVHSQLFSITRQDRERLSGHKGRVIWFTGLPASGKSTIANALEVQLHAQGIHTYILDGDNVRRGLNKDLGFTDPDRVENIRRVAEVAKLMMDAGLTVLAAFISPFRSEREMAKELIGKENFIEVYVSTPLEVCESRDPKGLYKKARAGQLPNMSGIGSRYEPPLAADVVINTAITDLSSAVSAVNEHLKAADSK